MKKLASKKTDRTASKPRKNSADIKRRSFLFSDDAVWLWDSGDEKARIMSADFRQVTSSRSSRR